MTTEELNAIIAKAEAGNPEAQNDLGLCFVTGWGVGKDFSKAVEWFTKAAEQGSAKAQANLGVCFEKGWGVEKSLTKAIEWYLKAAEQGFAQAKIKLPQAYYDLAHSLGIDDINGEGRKYLNIAAERGNEKAKKRDRGLISERCGKWRP